MNEINTFIVFIKKELMEQWRNYRIIVLFSVLLLFGMSSPLLAKLMPEIFKSIDVGFEIKMPEPTFADAYAQFFKNMSQVSLIVIILVFSGSITQEKIKGTAILILSKGLSRKTFVVSKFIASVLLWTIAFAVSVIVFYGYTEYLFPGQNPQNFMISMFSFWLFVVFLLSVSTLTGLIGNSFYIPAVLTFGVLALMFAIGAVPKTVKYSPIALSSWNVDMILGTKGISDITISLTITVLLTVICIVSSVIIFSKQEL
ncbi:MAG: ABC transporter permease [Firmicutes bacterium]|nr:ABC transporter permease [Bacillota bacterium]